MRGGSTCSEEAEEIRELLGARWCDNNLGTVYVRRGPPSSCCQSCSEVGIRAARRFA